MQIGLLAMGIAVLPMNSNAQTVTLPRQGTATAVRADDHYRAGFTYGEQGRFTEAVAELSQAIQLNPNHIEAHFYLGEAYAELGQFDRAIAEYRQVLSLRPDDVDAHYDLSRLYLARKEFEPAWEQARAVERLDAHLANELFTALRRASPTPAR